MTTEATVTFCHYQSRALSALAFGFRLGEKFRIGFSYRAHGRLYSGEFDSPFAIPQNERIPISYNPLAPEQNNRAAGIAGTRSTRTLLLPVSLAVAVILSLGWLTVLHGCNPR
jgi:hypothetical protein